MASPPKKCFPPRAPAARSAPISAITSADDLLAHPGEQDLTAHVNFSAIQKIGEDGGLKTENFCTQPQFLTRILEKAMTDKSFGEWNAAARASFKPSRTRNIWAAPSACWFSRVEPAPRAPT